MLDLDEVEEGRADIVLLDGHEVVEHAAEDVEGDGAGLHAAGGAVARAWAPRAGRGSRPALSEWYITAELAGEQPMTRVEGESALMMPATPQASPPPPTAT